MSRRSPDRALRLARAALLAGAVSLPAAALAEMPAYRDDRSDPAAVVASLYNALARREYARAWGYFGDAKPTVDYATFVAGYDDTAGVALTVGTVTTEGAAGSIIGHVPVAVAATGSDGSQRVFAGCYTTRLLQPAVQEPPFRPLFIETGTLRAAGAAPQDALPATCDPG